MKPSRRPTPKSGEGGAAMSDFSDIEAAVARMPRSVPDEMLTARWAAESAPPPEPTIVPEPTFPYPLNTGHGGTARFPCPLELRLVPRGEPERRTARPDPAARRVHPGRHQPRHHRPGQRPR